MHQPVLRTAGVTMAQLLQDVGNGYHKPFFQAYLIHSSYSVYYVCWKLWM